MKRGSTASRLLEEAVLFHEGINGLVKMADEHGNEHLALYLAAMKEYEKKHDYLQIEEIGQKAVKKLDVRWIIRSEAALKAAYASSYLGHKEGMMQFCWESFCSNSTVRNFLRLFGTKEMAGQMQL